MGTLEGYTQRGVESKEWVTARDAKVRGNDPEDEYSHVDLDGTIILMAAMFEQNGVSTLAPGMSGVPGFDINCRCRIAPVVGSLK